MTTLIGLSQSLETLARGAAWIEQSDGASSGRVFRIDRPNLPSVFLKWGRDSAAGDITREFARLTWLQNRTSVPTVEHFEYSTSEAWLVTGAVPGTAARHLLDKRPETRRQTITALAGFLRAFHKIPIEACPFDGSIRVRLFQARENIDAGLVDRDNFDNERLGWTPEQVWDELLRLRPEISDLVVTHGDFSLDNIIIANGHVAGCIDVGRAGVADRYQDIAILWRDLGEYGEGAQQSFLSEYGITELDEHKLEFYLCLDELF